MGLFIWPKLGVLAVFHHLPNTRKSLVEVVFRQLFILISSLEKEEKNVNNVHYWLTFALTRLARIRHKTSHSMYGEH